MNVCLKDKPQGFELKEFKLQVMQIDLDSREVYGYAATWDVDDGNDKIHPGAFEATIKEKFYGAMERKGSPDIRIFYQHYSDRPIGVLQSIKEDEKGLWIRYKISDVPYGNEALTLLRDKAIDSHSIGFVVKNATWDEATGRRDIYEIELFEASPVSIPMNRHALVLGVKALGGGLDRIAQANELLRQGYSTDEILQKLGKGPMPPPPSKEGSEPMDLPFLKKMREEAEAHLKAGKVLSDENQSELLQALSSLLKIASNAKIGGGKDPDPNPDGSTDPNGLHRCAACNKDLSENGVCMHCAAVQEKAQGEDADPWLPGMTWLMEHGRNAKQARARMFELVLAKELGQELQPVSAEWPDPPGELIPGVTTTYDSTEGKTSEEEVLRTEQNFYADMTAALRGTGEQ